MGDVIEKMAEQLAFKLTPLTPKGMKECKWPDDWGYGEQKSMRDAARAALAAALEDMMEPSLDAMLAADWGEPWQPPNFSKPAGINEQKRMPLKSWQAMLTQYRKETSGG